MKSENVLKSDRDYLLHLNERLGSDEFDDLYEQSIRMSITPEAIEVSKELGILRDQSDVDILLRDAKELLDPTKRIFGDDSKRIKNLADIYLSDKELKIVNSITFCMMQTKEFNGCAIKTPLSNSVVMLNEGLYNQIKDLVFMSYVILMENTNKRHSKLLSRENIRAVFYHNFKEYFDINVNVQEETLRVYYADIIGKNYLDQGKRNTILSFVILHEYGHILSGHLDEISSLNINSNVKVDAYNRSWKMEIEADTFALKRIIKSFQNVDFFIISIFFCFLNSIEVIKIAHQAVKDRNIPKSVVRYYSNKMHPPSIERLHNFYSLLDLSNKKHTLALSLSSMVEDTFKWLVVSTGIISEADYITLQSTQRLTYEKSLS